MTQCKYFYNDFITVKLLRITLRSLQLKNNCIIHSECNLCCEMAYSTIQLPYTPFNCMIFHFVLGFKLQFYHLKIQNTHNIFIFKFKFKGIGDVLQLHYYF